MIVNSTTFNSGTGTATEEKSSNLASVTLTNSLTNYLGYFDSDDRRATANVFVTNLEERYKPIATLSESIDLRFAKVGKLKILWFFDNIKTYAETIIEKHNLGNTDSKFYSTQYLTAEEANQISIVELELLSHLDELFLFLKSETEEVSLEEIENKVPVIKEKFEKLDMYLEMRIELINSYSERQKRITDVISELDSLISDQQATESIIGIINKIENEYSDFPLIYLELLETFHNHIAHYRHIAQSSDEHEKAIIDYFTEYVRIIEISESLSDKSIFKDYEQLKVEELLNWSKSIIDIRMKLKPIAKSSRIPGKADNENSKYSILRIIIGIAVSLTIIAIIWVIKF